MGVVFFGVYQYITYIFDIFTVIRRIFYIIWELKDIKILKINYLWRKIMDDFDLYKFIYKKN